MTVKGTVEMTPPHRVAVLVLIVLQYALFAWSLLLMVNYHAIRLPFLGYPSMVAAEPADGRPGGDAVPGETHYGRNVLLYMLFWVQHILMATLKYKMAWFSRWRYFAVYDRYAYNISSGLALWFIFANLKPCWHSLFTVPEWACLPLSLAAVGMLAKAMAELGGRIMMPYRLEDILRSRQLAFAPYEAKGMEGLKEGGVYAYVRNPMQGAVLVLMVFGNGVYTTERLLYVLVMGLGVVVGVLMEEKRMLLQFRDYEGYMARVSARFIPLPLP